MCNYKKGIKEKQGYVMKCVFIILMESTTNDIFDFRHVILCRHVHREGRSHVFCKKHVWHYNKTNAMTLKILRGLNPKLEIGYKDA